MLRYFNYTHTNAAQNATTATRNSIDFNAPTTHHRNTQHHHFAYQRHKELRIPETEVT